MEEGMDIADYWRAILRNEISTALSGLREDGEAADDLTRALDLWVDRKIADALSEACRTHAPRAEAKGY